MGGRGRRHSFEERDLILGLIDEAVRAGARQNAACDLLGIDRGTPVRWKKEGVGDDR